MQDRRKGIALDFDGVLHSFKSGWEGIDAISDPPNKGAIQWLRGLILDTRFDVFIHSARCKKPEGIAAMMKWLRRYGLEAELLGQIIFADKKPPVQVILDDRAIRFSGVFPSYNELACFQPWWKVKSPPGRRESHTDANYQGVETEAEAEKIWREECRCLTCVHLPVCKVARAIKEVGALSSVSQCLAYIETFMPEFE